MGDLAPLSFRQELRVNKPGTRREQLKHTQCRPAYICYYFYIQPV